MKLIIGLGNPGAKYANNRHNVGHMVIDQLKNKITKKQNNLKLVKTDVFMNDSGKDVKRLITNHHSLITDLYIVHDDLDIPLGQFKIQFGRGPKDHNGINSVEEELKTKDFWRIRIGIENRDKENRISGEVYTLQDFEPAESIIIDKVIKEVCLSLQKLETS